MVTRKPVDRSKPYTPAPYSKYDVMAFKALSLGLASPHQQQRCLNWLVNQAARTYDLPYHPGGDGDRDTAFASGKMFVGQQVVKLVNYDNALLNRMNEE